MNNLSDDGHNRFPDFNSVSDPFERERKHSIMSLSMTSSVASDGYDIDESFCQAKHLLHFSICISAVIRINTIHSYQPNVN